MMEPGIPTIEAYEAILQSPIVAELEASVKRFRGIFNADKVWTGGNSALGFSRKWEYPFVIDRLEKLKLSNNSIIDTGPGAIFFPFYLRARFPGIQYSGVDIDREACHSFNTFVEENHYKNVVLRYGDLRRLNLVKNESADIVLCISALEHIQNPFLVIHELHRILKPGGTLIISFDIALPDMSCAGAPLGPLLDFLYGIFHLDIPTNIIGPRPDSVSTEYIRKQHPESLPWKNPDHFRNLIFYCDDIEKPGQVSRSRPCR